MIKVSYIKDKLIKEVKISGHAMYDSYGKDIVCSAVSTLVTTTINNIITLDENSICYENSSGYILITNKDSEMASKLLNNMLDMLSELASNYPKNIKIGG
ncbi:MAG: ribosomal-processing cysteine protease Prp [Bacilli bacterium]|nr:ribosomal-processing cysteine protease Prp [Bacilli bacterium]